MDHSEIKFKKPVVLDSIKIHDQDTSFIIQKDSLRSIEKKKDTLDVSRDIISFYNVIRTSATNEENSDLKQYTGETGMENSMKEFIQNLDMKCSYNSVKEIYEEDDMLVMEINPESELTIKKLTPNAFQ